MFWIAACAPVAIRTEPTPQIYVYRFPSISRNIPHVEKSVALLGPCESAYEVGARRIYTYGTSNPHCNGVTWDAMIWGREQIDAEIEPSEYLIGFNEPDSPTQSNISPSDATALIRRIEKRFPDRKLVSPAPSQLGLDWLERTRDAYHSEFGAFPRWDVVAIHCYFGDRASLEWCKHNVTWFAGKLRDWGASELWLTEFASVPGVPGVDAVALESEFVDWLKVTGHATRFYHFASRWDDAWGDGGNGCDNCADYALFRNGAITPHGVMYRGK